MDGEDDDVSFLSISDSDVESESVGSYSCPSVFHDIPRADSPATSVSSCRSLRRRGTPKRMAPPPPLASIPLSVSDPHKFKVPSSSFRQEYLKRVPGGLTIVAPIPVKDLGAIASHPIQLLPSSADLKGSGLGSVAPAGENQNDLNQHPLVLDGPSRDFSRLQIRLIDDEPEIINNASVVHSAPAMLDQEPFSAQSTAICTVNDVSLPPQQIISSSTATALPTPVYYTSSANFSHSPNVTVANPPSLPMTDLCDPLNSQNINSSLPYATFPISSQVYLSNPQPTYLPGQYVSLSAFGTVPQTQKDVIGATTSNYSIQTNYRLSHSASEPGLVRVIGRSLDSFQRKGRRLESLSEEEEDSVFSDDNSAAVECSDVRRSRCRVSRSNSNVTVAHLYEDLLVSPRFNLKVTLTNLTVVVVLAALFLPNSSSLIFNAFRLIFGTLFPAYYSYKAVRTKNVKEYVKWMMYWIVFALFTCIETITDVFLSFWFPFYYEIKILVVLWLLSPATRGSSILYRKFVHPWLTRREEEIDDCIAKAKQQGYSTVVQLGTKGVNYATTVIMQTAIKGGGGLVSQLKRSYSASEIGEDVADVNRNLKALPLKEERHHHDVVILDDDDRSVSSGSHESEIRTRSESESSSHRIRGHSTGRAVRSAKTRSADISDVHFLDVTDGTLQRRSPRTHDVMRYPHMPLYLDPLRSESVPLRRNKCKLGTRVKSMTIGSTPISRDAIMKAQRHSSYLMTSEIPENWSL